MCLVHAPTYVKRHPGISLRDALAAFLVSTGGASHSYFQYSAANWLVDSSWRWDPLLSANLRGLAAAALPESASSTRADALSAWHTPIDGRTAAGTVQCSPAVPRATQRSSPTDDGPAAPAGSLCEQPELERVLDAGPGGVRAVGGRERGRRTASRAGARGSVRAPPVVGVRSLKRRSLLKNKETNTWAGATPSSENTLRRPSYAD